MMDTNTLMELLKRRSGEIKNKNLPVKIAKYNGTAFRDVVGVDIRTDINGYETVVLIYEEKGGN